MNHGSRTSARPLDLSVLVARHFQKARISFVPISIRKHADDLKREIGSAAVSDDEIVREVERCAIERGLPVYFDGRRKAGASRHAGERHTA